MGAVVEYETIHRLLNNYRTENFDKINVYGVITFMNAPRLTISNNYCTSITIVDQSCTFDEKLKTIVFSSSDDLHTVHRSCEIGDIIRFHRFKVQDYKSQAQGCSNAAFTSWIRFKKDADDFAFEGNKNSMITEQDEKMVKGLRDWLKTKPSLAGLIEAKLSDPVAMDIGEPAADAVAGQSPSKRSRLSEETACAANREMGLFNKLLYLQPRLTTFANIKQDGFFDLVCQLCAKCSSKGFKFIIVWDGTTTNLAVHQENEFVFENAEGENEDSKKIFYKRSITDKAYQVFLFDEYAQLTSDLEPGDFLLLKNANSKHPSNSVADTVIKMPSGGKSYKRDIIKLASVDGNVNIPRDCPEALNAIVNRIRDIKAAGDALKITFIDESQFFTIFRSLSFNDSVLNDNTNKRSSPAKAASAGSRPNDGKGAKQPVSVDALLRDQISQYASDDENGDEENVPRTSPRKSNPTNPRTPNSRVSSPTRSRRQSPQKSHSSNAVSAAASEQQLPDASPLRLSRSEGLALMSASHEERNDQFYKSLPSRFHLKPVRIPLRRVDLDRVKNETDSASSQEFHSAEGHVPSQSSHHTSEPPPPPAIPLSLVSSEISTDISQLTKLVNMTYVVPFFTEASYAMSRPPLPSINQAPGQQLFFDNLNYLNEASQSAGYIKCKVVAKLFNFAISSCPQIAIVFVNCKKCGYINFTPFHLAGIHQAPLFSSVLNDLHRRGEESPMELDEQTEASDREEFVNFIFTETITNAETGQTTEQQRRLRIPSFQAEKFRDDLKCAQNFSLRWLKSVMPFDMHIRATQAATQTQSAADSDSIPIMFYECPRCAFRAKYLDRPNQAHSASAQTDNDEDADDPNYTPVTLDYIYRFWFILRDPQGQLDTCLLEGDAAQKFLNIPASKFYTNTKMAEPGAKGKTAASKNASHLVYQHINKCFNKKYLFSIETFNLRSTANGETAPASAAATPAPASVEPKASRLGKKKEIQVVYKITDMVEVL